MVNNKHKGSGRMRMSLFEIYQDIINEVLNFENITPYKLFSTSEGWMFNAEIKSEKVEVFIYVEPVSISNFEISHWYKNAKNVVNFGFEVGQQRATNQYEKTNFKDYIKILATVGYALNSYIKTNDPDIITFFSDSKFSDPQKDNIYFAALEKNLPVGYDIGDVFHKKTRKKGIMIFNKDKFV